MRRRRHRLTPPRGRSGRTRGETSEARDCWRTASASTCGWRRTPRSRLSSGIAGVRLRPGWFAVLVADRRQPRHHADDAEPCQRARQVDDHADPARPGPRAARSAAAGAGRQAKLCAALTAAGAEKLGAARGRTRRCTTASSTSIVGREAGAARAAAADHRGARLSGVATEATTYTAGTALLEALIEAASPTSSPISAATIRRSSRRSPRRAATGGRSRPSSPARTRWWR